MDNIRLIQLALIVVGAIINALIPNEHSVFKYTWGFIVGTVVALVKII